MEEINIKHYKIKSPLGSGSFGRVFLVKNKKDKKEYAAKVSNIPFKDKTEQKENVQIISREVNILSKINHPAILKFHGFSKKDFEGNPFPTFIIEYAKNDNLSKILDQERRGLAPPEWDDTKKYLNLYGIAYGMSFLHQNNIIHRDLKTENIMEDEYLLPKIGDFGLSKIYDPTQRSKQSMAGGTLYYMAPEIFTEDHYNSSVDVYAYSIILFEVLTSQEPYSEITNPNMIQMKIVNNYRPKFPKGFQVTDSMNDLITRCWSQNPSSRPSFSEILEILKDPGFYNDSGFEIDENDFLIYQDYLEAEINSFDAKKKSVLNIESFIKNKQKSSIRKVIANQDNEPKKKKRSFFLKPKADTKKAKTDFQALKRVPKNDSNDDNKKIKPEDDHNQHKNSEDDKNAHKSSEDKKANKSKPKIKIYPILEYSKLDKECQELIQEAENGDNNSIVTAAISLLKGQNSFPQNFQLGIKYLNYGIEHNNVECMEIYGKMLLEGKEIPQNETKAIEILKKAADDFQSDLSKILIVKNILSKEIGDEELNYVLAKKYAKEAANNGNVEAYVLYGQLCERRVTNKYGTIEQNFEEAFKYFKLAYELGDADGTAWYGYYFESPHGLFKPDVEQAVKLAKLAADKGSLLGLTRHAVHYLHGIGLPKNTTKGCQILSQAIEKEYPDALHVYGLELYYGINDIITQDKDKGLEYLKKAASKGNIRSIYHAAQYAKENGSDITELKNVEKKLIERGMVFLNREEEIFYDENKYPRYEAAVEFDKNNFDKGLGILKPYVDNNCVGAMLDYAYVLTFDLKKPLEGKKLYNKAANYKDEIAIKDYIKYLESGSFGRVYTDEANKYKEILKYYGIEVDGDNSSKISIYPINDLKNLSTPCQELVQEAEGGNDSSLVSVAKNLIGGKNLFPKNVQLGIKYLNHGIENKNVECMEIYGKMLLEGNVILKNEEKALEILTKAANNFQSDESKVLIAKNIMNKGERGEIVNYVLAKKYAKEAANNGNVEAYVIYGLICEKSISNKYGTIERNFEEAFKYFKFAYERGDAEGTTWYSYYLQYPHGLFKPNIEQSVKLTKIAADKGSTFAISRLGLFNLNGICMPKNNKEGWRLMNIAMKKDENSAIFFNGLAYYYGLYDMPKDENKGLKYIKKAALRGFKQALFRYALLADKYPEKINVNKIKKKLIEEGYIFTGFQHNDFGDDQDIVSIACFELDKKNYDKAIDILKQAMNKNFIIAHKLYAEVLTTELNRPMDGKKLYEKACNFFDLDSTKDYIKYCEEGKFGKIDPDEIRPYKEILEIYKDFI